MKGGIFCYADGVSPPFSLVLFTTSWDDGLASDLRVAEILHRAGCRGTLYLCPRMPGGRAMLSSDAVRSLQGMGHEVGAHSLTHPRLTTLSPERLHEEVAGSKAWAEEQTGRACTMFCYPKGDVNAAVRDAVRRAGFLGARTTIAYRLGRGTDPFLLPTTLQLSPFPWRGHYWKWWHRMDPLGPLRVAWPSLSALRVPLRHRSSWQALARALFLMCQRTEKGVFHLWGHSAELDRYGLWDELASFLAFVREHGEGVRHCVNGELVRGSAS